MKISNNKIKKHILNLTKFAVINQNNTLSSDLRVIDANQIKTIDYDIIGLSFYPLWHGKSLNGLKSTMHNLSLVHDKEIIIAETAYPFTLDWNDWTNNIVGLESQLILPDYPATSTGQKDFINAIKTFIFNRW